MSKEMSILRALRERTTLAQEIAKASERATKNAVVFESEKENVDFDTTEQICVFDEKQYDLRALKTAIAKASLTNEVQIPEGLGGSEGPGINESGKKVPVFQAILIRDDLKGKKKLLESLVKIDISLERDLYLMREDQEPKKRIRLFDFNAVLVEIYEIQTAIDEIDAAIQYIDSTQKISL